MGIELQEKRLARIEDRLDHLTSDVSEIKTSLARQKGFISGFAAAFSLLWGIVIALGAYIWKQFHG
jgi:hypothetical protein